tara:strand:+ start:80 stop:370 length:291 start_codon:yes stop_codon:yes gene_type:complete
MNNIKEKSKLVFVVDVGDALSVLINGRYYGFEKFRAYPSKVVFAVNQYLKRDGLSTVKFVTTEKGLEYNVCENGDWSELDEAKSAFCDEMYNKEVA